MVQCQVLVIGGDIGQSTPGVNILFYWRDYRAQLLKGRLVLNPEFFFFLQKHFFGQFSVIFKSIQSSTC